MQELRYLRESALRKAADRHPPNGYAPQAEPGHAAGRYCAYNQTRERFLGTDVEAADFSAASFDAHLQSLTPGSGSAMWVVPFRGISPTSVRVPLDLVYLDRNCVVLDTVESFPLARVSPSSKPAASVLVLPAQTIASAGTQPGDQLILCAPEEMKRRLGQWTDAKTGPGPRARRNPAPGQAAASRSDPPTRKAGVYVLQWEGRSVPEQPVGNASAATLPAAALSALEPAAHDPGSAEPAKENSAAPKKKNWLQRFWSIDPPEPRQATREALPGIAAYFFTGGTPKAHAIRDISRTGLFVFTEERWYIGTVVRMTLTDRNEPTAERSITVNACVVRWGNDGVGLSFVLQDNKKQRPAELIAAEGLDGGASRAEVDQFLKRFKTGAK